MNIVHKIASLIINTLWFQNWRLMQRHIKEIKNTRLTVKDLYSIHSMLNALSVANHKKIQVIADGLIKKSNSVGYFYLAQSLSLQNNVKEAADNLKKFLKTEPYHTDASILLSELEFENGQTESARNRLYQLLEYSKRRKIWQALSNMVNTEEDFTHFFDIFSKKFPHFKDECIPNDLSNHLSNAALRADKSQFALEFWQNQYALFQVRSLEVGSKKISLQKKFDDKNAAIALAAIKNCLDKHRVPFFLISGTLLGCIRENKLLGHDKDIDIGVWDSISIDQLKSLIKSSGCFYILPVYSKDILVVRHVNGISIDIFIHYRSENDYWHAGRKCSWHNTPFELIEYPFLGGSYLIPANYDLYLSENYGQDWRIPKVEFDSALDTPNMRILSEKEYLIYLYKRILINNFTLSVSIKDRIIKKIDFYNS